MAYVRQTDGFVVALGKRSHGSVTSVVRAIPQVNGRRQNYGAPENAST